MSVLENLSSYMHVIKIAEFVKTHYKRFPTLVLL